jgi:hypothetical protein
MIEEPERPTKGRSRLEDEVLEILSRSERPPTVAERARGTIRTTRRSLRFEADHWLDSLLHYFESGLWLIALIVLGFAAYFLEDTSRLLSKILVLICLGLFGLAIFRSIQRPSRGPVKQWRGRDMELTPMTRPLWVDKILRSTRRPPKR